MPATMRKQDIGILKYIFNEFFIHLEAQPWQETRGTTFYSPPSR